MGDFECFSGVNRVYEEGGWLAHLKACLYKSQCGYGSPNGYILYVQRYIASELAINE